MCTGCGAERRYEVVALHFPASTRGATTSYLLSAPHPVHIPAASTPGEDDAPGGAPWRPRFAERGAAPLVVSWRELRAGITRSASSLRACHLTHAYDLGVAGEATIDLVFRGGRRLVGLEGTTLPDGVAECLELVVMGMQLPSPITDGTYEISYSYGAPAP
jgi:hypothetical protein